MSSDSTTSALAGLSYKVVHNTQTISLGATGTTFGITIDGVEIKRSISLISLELVSRCSGGIKDVRR
ncbi:hypothetical protein [Streptomyces sp. NPDC048419]|uniref:hypothetical protein n=1 Tax=Streptomyces sp. NPDC048419 TaxID=3365547 RepID=UPI00371AECA9